MRAKVIGREKLRLRADYCGSWPGPASVVSHVAAATEKTLDYSNLPVPCVERVV